VQADPAQTAECQQPTEIIFTNIIS
jgi:hypothetical protein